MQRSTEYLTLAMLFLASALATTVGAENWSRFHGSNGTGYQADASIPDQWTPQDYAWKVDLGAADVGSPIVQNGKVFLLSSDPSSAERRVVALNLESGKQLWQKSYPSASHRLHQRNTYSSSTPAANDQYVYVAWAEPEHTFLKCFTHEGDEVWSRDFGSWKSQHGFGTSPTLIGELLILFDSQQAEQMPAGVAPGQSRMLAVDPQTGETIWETPLTTTRVCYGVPALYEPVDGGAKQIVGTNTGDGVFGLDYATGKMLWNEKVFSARCVSSPIVAGDLVIGSAGSGGGGNHLVAVKPTARGAEEVYRIEKGAPYVPTSVLAGKYLFIVSDKGLASCADATTGESLWLERVGGNYGASPIVLGEKMLIISLSGEASVLSASPKFNAISQFDLGGPVGATPVYDSGCLLLRIGNQLCCLKTR